MFIQYGKSEYLASIGSSNFSQRSYERDTELNFYVYSKNSQLKKMMENERKFILEDCKEFDVNKMERRSILGKMADWIFWVFARGNKIC